MVEVVEEPVDVELGHPTITATDRLTYPTHRLRRAATATEPERARQEPCVEDRADHRQGGVLHHPVRDRGHPERTHPPVGFGDLHPPHRRGNVAFRRQQPPSQPAELMLDVCVERCDRLAVDPGRTRIRADSGPRGCEILGIGDGFQQLAQPPTFRSQPLPSHRPTSRAASLLNPLGGPRLIPLRARRA